MMRSSMTMKLRAAAAGPALRRARHGSRSFTLIELLAVVMVIVFLAALSTGIAGYVQKRVAAQNTRAQIALIEAALDNYKADFGYYPLTTPIRISTAVICESTNNAILYRALF